MDRFAWTDGLLEANEQLVCQQSGVRLYDGDNKTAFDDGKLVLTNHRIIWRDSKDQKCVMSLALSYVIYTEDQAASFTKSAKIVAHLQASSGYKPPGPMLSSKSNYVRFSFKESGEREFHRNFREMLSKKQWENKSALPVLTSQTGTRKMRTGIMGIERNIQQKHKETDKNISQAFQDLTKLMDKAKEMVVLSKNISNKIKERQGDITEDETVRFKSYLLSLGIEDPVTRDTHGTGDKYYRELAKQIAASLQKPLKECGGMMTLTDVYCRINRARGMELLSPEDLVNACKLMSQLHLPVRLKVFESGVMVLQLESHSEEKIVEQTSAVVLEQESLTAEELSKLIGLSVILSKERLLSAERVGKVCRDESLQGLRFYPNYFLTGLPT